MKIKKNLKILRISDLASWQNIKQTGASRTG
nr:MAG TPA: hypothetical protein [Caudoviricetes sp.]